MHDTCRVAVNVQIETSFIGGQAVSCTAYLFPQLVVPLSYPMPYCRDMQPGVPLKDVHPFDEPRDVEIVARWVAGQGRGPGANGWLPYVHRQGECG